MFLVRAVGVVVTAVVLSGSSLAAPAGAVPAARRPAIRMNEIQVLATHNSYHQRPNRRLIPMEPADYSHPPLDVQLTEQGIRSLEIDIFNGAGFPVMHTPRIDNISTCPMFADCLHAIAQWHDAHPSHVPLFVMVDLREQTTVLDASLVTWDPAAVTRVDAAIRSVFHGGSLLEPDDVRGRAKTLRDAVTGRGWPTLDQARGRVAFVLNRADAIRDAYLEGAPSLEGRAMFVTASVNAPSAAFIKRDEPDERAIRRLVKRGFIVRTRADANAVEARANDHRRADRAIRSGAQIVATDYQVADPTIGPYVVSLRSGPLQARCDPVNAPKGCRDRDLERPRRG